MSKVLLLGHGPLPFENETKVFGPGIRTWQFAKPLIADGHEVVVVCSRIPFVYADDLPPVVTTTHDGAVIHSVLQAEFEQGPFVQEMLDTLRPDCLVAATVFPSFVATRLHTDLPLWADFFGDPMAEAQAKAFTYADDRYLAHFAQFTGAVLARADVFSSVSEAQRYALIGQLGLAGRLNRHTFGYEFVHCIPCAVDPTEPVDGRKVLRGVRVAAGDFVVLWSGGYNTWTDVETLFKGLELAMARDPRIVFASTGGQIAGHDEITYPRFLKLIEGSPFRDRFIMLGWVPNEDVPSYYRESDLGINIDAWNYEALLGSRNRLLHWMSLGLPVLTTETSEITKIIRARKLGFVFAHRDAASLANAILAAACDPDERQRRAARAREFTLTHWTFPATTRALRRWVESPAAAPDRGKTLPLLLGTGSLATDVAAGSSDSRADLAGAELPAASGEAERPGQADRAGQGLGRLASALLRPINHVSRFFYYTRTRGLGRTRERLAEIVSDETPAVLAAGSATTVTLTLVNRGQLTWFPAPSTNPVNLSYHWADLRGRAVVFDGLRTALPGAVGPGQGIELRARIEAPARPGLYLLQYDLVQEQVTWFGEASGQPRLQLIVAVLSRPETTTELPRFKTTGDPRTA